MNKNIHLLIACAIGFIAGRIIRCIAFYGEKGYFNLSEAFNSIGMPSGHAILITTLAISYFLWFGFKAEGTPVFLLMYGLLYYYDMMLYHSANFFGHSAIELLVGTIIGIGAALLYYFLFKEFESIKEVEKKWNSQKKKRKI